MVAREEQKDVKISRLESKVLQLQVTIRLSKINRVQFNDNGLI